MTRRGEQRAVAALPGTTGARGRISACGPRLLNLRRRDRRIWAGRRLYEATLGTWAGSHRAARTHPSPIRASRPGFGEVGNCRAGRGFEVIRRSDPGEV